MKTALCIAVAAAIGISFSAARASPRTSECSVDRMETNPASVEEPCSAKLRLPGLAANDRAETYYIRGRGRHRTSRIPLAGEDYDEAIALNPKIASVYIDRSNVHFRAGRGRAGMADLETAFAIDDKHPRVLVSWARLMFDSGQHEEGLKLFRSALNVAPAHAFALHFRSDAFTKLGRLREALQDAEALVAIPPDRIERFGFVPATGELGSFHAAALAQRAQVRKAMGDHAGAEADLDAAVAHSPSAYTWWQRARFFARRPGRELDALRDLDRIVAVWPSYPGVNTERGSVLGNLNRNDASLAALDLALRDDPRDTTAYQIRAVILQSIGRVDEGFEDRVRAMTFDPQLIRRVLPNLRRFGYYQSGEVPTFVTPLFSDALKACFLDPQCRAH